MPSTALLTVSSSDRYPNYAASRGTIDGLGNIETLPTSPYDFTIRKNQSIMNGFFTRIGVTQVRFPWIIPNVNFSTCKILFVTAAATYPITITVGFYTPENLAAALQAAIRAIPGGAFSTFTVTYGDFTSLPRFRFDAQSGVDFTFAPMPSNYTPGPLFYPYAESRRQLYDLLGLTYLITANPSFSVSPLKPNFTGGDTLCQYTNYVDIVCSDITLNQNLKDDSTSTKAFDTLCRLYVTAPDQGLLPGADGFAPPGTTPQVLYNDYNNPKQIRWNAVQPIGQLRFQVTDDQGFPLETSINEPGNFYDINVFKIALTGGEWDMTLQVTEN